ncbi:MAG TPA: hypothetical protein ENF78_00360 [Candidatus Bathyarchaeota archaeon]|nr:hypothetical protein [Candidatus Bathyarchaeota archaeon]
MRGLLDPILVLYVLLASLLISPVVECLGRSKALPSLPRALSLASPLTTLLMASYCLLMPYLSGQALGWPIVIAFGPLGLSTTFLVDRASLLLAVVALLVASAASLYALSQPYEPGFSTAFLGLCLGMVGVLFSGDLLVLYVFWEVMCLSAYALVALGGDRKAALEAAWKYFIMGSSGALVMLFGASLLYGMAGTLNLLQLAERLSGASGPWLQIALLIFVAGAGVEAALVPLHTWLPDAYSEAPTPVSATLAGITTEIGFFWLLKALLTIFHQSASGWHVLLALVGVANMFLGNFCALVQSDVKRFLAYSSLAVIGYMAAALAVGTAGSISALIFLIISHAFSKSLAFLGAGSLASVARSRLFSHLSRSRALRKAATTFLTLALTCRAGLPGTSGFVEKILLFSAFFSSAWWWLALAFLVNVVVAAAVYFRAVKELLRQEAEGQPARRGRTPLPELASFFTLSSFIIALGIWPWLALDLASLGAQDLLSLGHQEG